MIPVKQTLFATQPGEGAGNCLQAAIASLLELPLEAVPHFAAIKGEELDGLGRRAWFRAVEEWLADRGLALVSWPWEAGVYVGVGTFVLIHGHSPRGDFLHTIVGRAELGRFDYVHDPHPAGGWIVGDPEELWVFVPSQKEAT